MKRLFPDLPRWSFHIEEKSAGVYEVIAHDERGRRFSRTDTDPEVVLERCHREAVELEPQSRNAG